MHGYRSTVTDQNEVASKSKSCDYFAMVEITISRDVFVCREMAGLVE